MVEKAQPYLLMIACGVIVLGAWMFGTFPERFNNMEDDVIRLQEHNILKEKTDAVQDQRIAALEEAMDQLGKAASETNWVVKYLKDRWDKWENYERTTKQNP